MGEIIFTLFEPNFVPPLKVKGVEQNRGSAAQRFRVECIGVCLVMGDAVFEYLKFYI